jgi:hypothetical protein
MLVLSGSSVAGALSGQPRFINLQHSQILFEKQQRKLPKKELEQQAQDHQNCLNCEIHRFSSCKPLTTRRNGSAYRSISMMAHHALLSSSELTKEDHSL